MCVTQASDEIVYIQVSMTLEVKGKAAFTLFIQKLLRQSATASSFVIVL
jgi:hypothetical protein